MLKNFCENVCLGGAITGLIIGYVIIPVGLLTAGTALVTDGICDVIMDKDIKK